MLQSWYRSCLIIYWLFLGIWLSTLIKDCVYSVYTYSFLYIIIEHSCYSTDNTIVFSFINYSYEGSTPERHCTCSINNYRWIYIFLEYYCYSVGNTAIFSSINLSGEFDWALLPGILFVHNIPIFGSPLELNTLTSLLIVELLVSVLPTPETFVEHSY